MSHLASTMQSGYREAGVVTDDDRMAHVLDSSFLDDAMIEDDEPMDSAEDEDDHGVGADEAEDDDDDEEDIDEDDDDDDDDETGNHQGSHAGGSSNAGNGDDEMDQKEKDAKLQQAQSELRKRIVMIQSDPKIPAAEKAKKIQELMTSQWTSKQKSQSSRAALADNKLNEKRQDFNIVLESDKVKTYHDKNSGIIGCKHYQRAAKLQAHCCGKWYTCRFCHDEVSDHSIIRNLTTTMMCMYCNFVQPAGQDCINPECERRVSKYYCKECKLWDDDPRKNIYHCYDCGICRIGKGLGLDYFHCKKCNVCMAISLKGRHKCIERNLESDCPICGEYMFTSTTTVIFMPCGHCIHYKCHQEYIQTSYQCPTCFKSLANMSEYFKRIDAMLSQHQMPPEYSNTQSFIYCNDCEKKSYAKFHFLYHKCAHCKGYNTKVLHTVEVKDGQLPGGAEVADSVAEKTTETVTPGAGSSSASSGSGPSSLSAPQAMPQTQSTASQQMAPLISASSSSSLFQQPHSRPHSASSSSFTTSSSIASLSNLPTSSPFPTSHHNQGLGHGHHNHHPQAFAHQQPHQHHTMTHSHPHQLQHPHANHHPHGHHHHHHHHQQNYPNSSGIIMQHSHQHPYSQSGSSSSLLYMEDGSSSSNSRPRSGLPPSFQHQGGSSSSFY